MLQYNYDDYSLDEDHISCLKQKVANLLQNLQLEESSHEVELVKEQGTPEWFNERRVRLTASLCKVIVSLKSDQGIMNFLNRYLSKTESVSMLAMQYGIKFEKKNCKGVLQAVKKC